MDLSSLAATLQILVWPRVKPEKLTRELKTSVEVRRKKPSSNNDPQKLNPKQAQSTQLLALQDLHPSTIDFVTPLLPDPLDTAHWQGGRYSSGTLLHPRASPVSGGVGHLLSF